MSCEKDVPTQQYESKANAWFSLSHGNNGRSERDQSASAQGACTSGGSDSAEVTVAEAPQFAFRKESRLRTRRHYRKTLSRGSRVFTRRFILYIRPRRGPQSRLGITVSRKVGSAVVRNRIKRCVREVFRTHPKWFSEPVDLVVVAKFHQGKGRESSPVLRRADFDYHDVEKELNEGIQNFYSGRFGERKIRNDSPRGG